MSNYHMWQPPRSPGDAFEVLDKLSDLIQFIADLSVMPSQPINEYPFSEKGYSGMYYFLIFIQETLDNCMDAIHKNSL